jgi:hypothetical protein
MGDKFVGRVGHRQSWTFVVNDLSDTQFGQNLSVSTRLLSHFSWQKVAQFDLYAEDFMNLCFPKF